MMIGFFAVAVFDVAVVDDDGGGDDDCYWCFAVRLMRRLLYAQMLFDMTVTVIRLDWPMS